MVVQHNLQAMNSNRMLGITEKTVAGTTEKLSSGYAINRAADNAAGLAISEKMRKQVRGLTQASTNAEDGISSVQTAEGALAEVQDMLQRMNELCVQAANGTNSSTDRQYIQDEIDQLVKEVDRVAETTKFNETYLLKGDKEKGLRSVYINDYSVTYAKNTVSNAIQDASKYKINYKGVNNIFVVSASIMNATSTTAMTADKIERDEDITKYFSDGLASTALTNMDTDATLGTINYDAHFNTTSYVALATCELNSSVTVFSGIPAETDELMGTNNARADLYIDIAQTGSVVRAARHIFIYDAETDSVVHKYAGDDMTKYLKEDNTMDDRYRMLGLITYDNAVNTASYGKHFNTAWDWNTSNLALEESTQQLYNANGEPVSAMALDNYFDENGNYKGGLFTTAQARDIDQVFASPGQTGYGNVHSIIGNTTADAATISKFIQQQERKINNDLSFTLHVGADSALENKITAEITSLTSAGLGISKLSSDNIGIVDGTGALATSAIDTIANAINLISRQRAALGAVQNRLEHTIKNLDNVVENTQSAESTIRDTDMATEMVAHSNANILQQAGQSMLAQSNQSNQGVLSLLQ